MSLTKLESDLASEIRRKYPQTAEGDALRTAIELVAASSVYKDIHGRVCHTGEAARRLPALFPPVGGDSDADRCARALAKEAILSGSMPAPQYVPSGDPRLERAMAEETRLAALFPGADS